MKLEDSQFKLKLKKAALENEIVLNEKHLEDFLLYKKQLIEYNKKVNLTAIIDDEQVIYKHFIDCLEIIKLINKDEQIIDIGTRRRISGNSNSYFFSKHNKHYFSRFTK